MKRNCVELLKSCSSHVHIASYDDRLPVCVVRGRDGVLMWSIGRARGKTAKIRIHECQFVCFFLFFSFKNYESLIYQFVRFFSRISKFDLSSYLTIIWLLDLAGYRSGSFSILTSVSGKREPLACGKRCWGGLEFCQKIPSLL